MRHRIGNLALSLLILLVSAIAIPIASGQTEESLLPLPTASGTVDPAETPSAMVHPRVVHKLPMKAKLAIAGSLLVFGLAALGFSLHRWKSWNLFDRQYRFPPIESAALRLGGKRSGGCMGSIEFGNASMTDETTSISEDA